MEANTIFTLPVRVYWEDTDAGGIVFYANYLKFFERARTEWLRSLGIQQRDLKETSGGMFVVAETTVKYLRSARLDDQLLVTAQLEQIGRSTLTIKQQALCGDTVLCEGSIRICWVQAETLKSSRIPSNLLEILQ
ncbi:acyl-CoA thioester hydrolase [Rhodoferax sp. OV413]|uniref:tol-pal system-associated acyl-CoA thioesterase n=1 Tax=Rhodoferax sp. OV413 TaxID=1855285 RepID=UPI0008878E65|nr:tol-pal system-associated acyl-CoA thioesterase [Rhodoferax sp. OV413]SDO34385.1 acyl-CoA thioester hydrolase [Rhodoferax sp. OV413]